MNEVMIIGDDNKLNIWYQDTDSMHLDYEQAETLPKLFNENIIKNLWVKIWDSFILISPQMEQLMIYIPLNHILLLKQVYINILESTQEPDPQLLGECNNIQGS